MPTPIYIREEHGALVAYTANGTFLAAATIYSRKPSALKAIRRDVEAMARPFTR